MNLKDLQKRVNKAWGAQKGNPCHRSDPDHALLHMTKAIGKVASALNDAQHERRDLRPGEVDKYLADLVICAARFGFGNCDLEAACEARLTEKFGARSEEKAELVWITGRIEAMDRGRLHVSAGNEREYLIRRRDELVAELGEA